MKIVIVEDSKTVRWQLVSLVQQFGHESLEYSDGAQFWEALPSLRNELLVVLDWEMPGYSGLELCSMIRRDYRDAAPYIIMVTAKDSPDDIVACLHAGANDYVTKPFIPDVLQARLTVGVRTIALQRELRSVNEQLLRSQTLATVGQLAAGAAHEINNPIAMVQSNSTLYQEYCQQLCAAIEQIKLLMPDNAALQEILAQADYQYIQSDFPQLTEGITNGTRRIKKITDTLRLFTDEYEQGGKSIDICQAARQQLGGDGRISLKLDPEIYCQIDAKKFEQVLFAITDNAFKATTDGGQVQLAITRQNDKAQIILRDTGVGMRDDVRLNAFNPFFTTRGVGAGVGLGLTLVTNIVTRYGGDVHLSSKEGKGTKLEIHLPLAK